MPTKLKCAVIGAGNMGQKYIKVLLEMPEVKLVAFSDVDLATAKEISSETGLFCYADYLEMIKKEEIDIVCICVPNDLHFKVTKDCIQAGLHILLEKPVCYKTETAEELIKYAKAQIMYLIKSIKKDILQVICE